MDLRARDDLLLRSNAVRSDKKVMISYRECNQHSKVIYCQVLAEREGFEPPVGFPLRRFSRPEQSTTLPPLRITPVYANVPVACWLQWFSWFIVRRFAAFASLVVLSFVVRLRGERMHHRKCVPALQPHRDDRDDAGIQARSLRKGIGDVAAELENLSAAAHLVRECYCTSPMYTP